MQKPGDRLHLCMSDRAELEVSRTRIRNLQELYESANNLVSLHEVNDVLQAIVERSRRLLASDVAYLLLLDEEQHEVYMRISAGIQTSKFLSIRLKYGEGLAGLIVNTEMPQWTSNYLNDVRFSPRIAKIVESESLDALLGVPLTASNQTIGVLFAAYRHIRGFTHDDVALLTSFASHAAAVLENASSLRAMRHALFKWEESSRQLEDQNASLQRSINLHGRLIRFVADGASLDDLVVAISDSIGGRVAVLTTDGTPLTSIASTGWLPTLDELSTISKDDGSSTYIGDPSGPKVSRVAPVRTGSYDLGFLFHRGNDLSPNEIRSLERAAMVAAIILLDQYTVNEVRSHHMAELVTALQDDPDIDESLVRERAASAGIGLPETSYVATVVLNTQSNNTNALLDVMYRLATKHCGIAKVCKDESIVLLPGTDSNAVSHSVSNYLSKELTGPACVGTTGPYNNLVETVKAVPRARSTAQFLITTRQWGKASSAESLGPFCLLFSNMTDQDLEEFILNTVGSLLAYDAERGTHLMQTLGGFYEMGGQTGLLAKQLQIHVNTLYQRLEKIDELLGAGWRRGTAALQTQFALWVHTLRNPAEG